MKSDRKEAATTAKTESVPTADGDQVTIRTVAGDNFPVAEEEYIVYIDYARDTKQMVPLQNLTSLGYSKQEVLDLRSDFLALIVFDNIRRPKTGVPPKWRISKAQGRFNTDDVKLLPKHEAEDVIRTARRREALRPEAKSVARTDARDKPSRPSSRELLERKDEQSRWRQRKIRTREKLALNPDGTKKNIYNVCNGMQNKKKNRVEDPLPHTSRFWMDIDTFRNLLRAEAELRLRLVGGDDFTQPIKDECDWRLGLYRDWLWTLEKGIGKPIVPTRSERVHFVSKPEEKEVSQKAARSSPREKSSRRERSDGRAQAEPPRAERRPPSREPRSPRRRK